MSKILNLRRDNCSNAIRVDRTTQLGNKFIMGVHGTRKEVIRKYSKWAEKKFIHDKDFRERVKALKDSDLACWCAPLPCHAEVLMALANRKDTSL